MPGPSTQLPGKPQIAILARLRFFDDRIIPAFQSWRESLKRRDANAGRTRIDIALLAFRHRAGEGAIVAGELPDERVGIVLEQLDDSGIGRCHVNEAEH